MGEETIPFMSRLKAIRDRMSQQAIDDAADGHEAASEEAAGDTLIAETGTVLPFGQDAANPFVDVPDDDDNVDNMWAMENEPEDLAKPLIDDDLLVEDDALAPVEAEVSIYDLAEPEDEAAAAGVDTKAEPAPEAEPALAPGSAWQAADVYEPDPEPEPANEPEVEEERPMRRGGRTKTRLLGVEHSDGKTVDLFAKVTANQVQTPLFPFGWLVVVAGPGRGEFVSLQSGVSQIGRDEDQAVQLDFGDTTISRQNHAAIAFDEEEASFFIGHGGKSNLVRLNGKPLLSTELMKNGDQIKIGETTLRLVTLCGKDFSWSDGSGKASPDNG